MSAKATRAEKVLTRIGDRLGLTPEGKQWLIAALDPFHDNPLDTTGYPDGSTSPCVTRVQKYTTSLTAPPNLAANTNWDCMILDTPHPQLIKIINSYMGVTGAGNPLNNLYNTSGSSNSFGGLWCVTAPSGASFDYASIQAGTGAGTYGIFPLTIDPALTAGDHRIIAKGFEVYNVSAELYKGGTVTVFESPLDSYTTAQTYSLVNSAASLTAQVSAVINPAWPQNATTAFALVNSKQWEAKDGCYVIGRTNQTEIPIENGINYTVPFYQIGNLTSGVITGTSVIPQADVDGGTGVPAILWENFNFTGAFFTGLSYQTALTTNYLIVIENHPSPQDNIYSLAKPPPCRDDIALSMYSCILREMPVGVPVNENGLGDWFADAVSTVADYVSPVLSAIPHPGAMALGAGLRASGNIAKAYSTNPTANIGSNMAAPAFSGVGGSVPSSKALTKLKNAEVRARNEEIKARNAALAAKKAAKAAAKM
jgi:hypothetical protein